MSQLEDYIKQAQEAGKSNEAIRQELSSTGWSEVDISGALGGTAPVTTVAPVISATVATGSTGGTVVKIILAVLVVGGAGWYLMFNSNDSSTNEPGANIQAEESTKPVAGSGAIAGTNPYNCEELLPVAEYKRIIQYNGNVSVTKEGRVGLSITCEYEQTDENADFRVPMHSLIVSFEFPVGPAAEYYEVSRRTHLGSYAQTISPDSELTNQDVVGVGAKAFMPSLFQGGVMNVLSTNQKYYFGLQIFPSKTDGVFLKDLGIIIDGNLSKY